VVQGFWIMDASANIGAGVQVGADIVFMDCYFQNDSPGYGADVINNGGNVLFMDSVSLGTGDDNLQQTGGTFLFDNF
jgi:hypothetical protein